MRALLSVILWLFAVPSLAQVNLDHDQFSLLPSAQIWFDREGTADINGILSGQIQPDWAVNDRGDRAFGFESDPLWLRWRIQRAQHHSADWILVPEYPMLDSVRVFITDQKGDLLSSSDTGRQMVMGLHPIQNHQLAMPIHLPQGESYLYMRVQTEGGLKPRAQLVLPERYISQSSKGAMYTGLMLGLLAAGAVIYVLLGIVMRAGAFIAIGAYFVMGGLWQATMSGALGSIWPAHLLMPRELIPMLLFTMAICIYSYLILIRQESGRKASPMDAVVLVALAMGALASWLIPYGIGTRAAVVGNFAIWVVAMFLAGFSRELPSETRIPIIVSAALYLVGAMLLFADTQGWLYLGQLSTSMYVVTAVPQMVLLTFGVALFAREQVLERRQADAELAVQVDLAAQARQETYALEQRRIADQRLIEEGLSVFKSVSQSDPLTGLPNRAALNEHIRLLSQKGVHSLALAVVDLDHFKRLNDSFGHSVGDQVLVKVAKVLADAQLRPLDFIARYGGEEFVFLMPNTGLIEAETAINNLLHNIRSIDLYSGYSKVEISASVGLARDSICQPIDFEALFNRADEALYSAKRGGRDRVEISVQPLSKSA